jgi:hypothetical protein
VKTSLAYVGIRRRSLQILLAAVAMGETSGCMLILSDGGYSTSTDSGSANSDSTSTGDGSAKSHGGDAAATGDEGGDGSSGDGSSNGPEGGTCPVPAGQACGVDPQCGCPSGQKCDVPMTTTTAVAGCVTAGDGESESVCVGNTDCAAGLSCVFEVCRPFCTAAELGSTCPPTTNSPALGECVQLNDDDVAVPQDTVCLFDCTPWPNNCPSGEGCVVLGANDTNLYYSDCEASGAGAAGATCASNSDCAAGTQCESSSFTCMQLCSTTSDCASLGAAYECDVDEFTVNGGTYGVCFLP